MTLIEIVRQFRILPAPETKVRTSLLDSQYTHTHTHTYRSFSVLLSIWMESGSQVQPGICHVAMVLLAELAI